MCSWGPSLLTDDIGGIRGSTRWWCSFAPAEMVDDVAPGTSAPGSVERLRTDGSWSAARTPPPEWPLIIPWDARNCLIFSLSS